MRTDDASDELSAQSSSRIRRGGSDIPHPEPMNRASELYQFGTTKSPDRKQRFNVEPRNPLLDRHGATSEFLHRFIQHCFDRSVRMNVLLGRQMFENLIGPDFGVLCGIELMSLQWRHSAILSVQ